MITRDGVLTAIFRLVSHATSPYLPVRQPISGTIKTPSFHRAIKQRRTMTPNNTGSFELNILYEPSLSGTAANRFLKKSGTNVHRHINAS